MCSRKGGAKYFLTPEMHLADVSNMNIYIYIYLYFFLPVTSFGGLFWGSKMS